MIYKQAHSLKQLASKPNACAKSLLHHFHRSAWSVNYGTGNKSFEQGGLRRTSLCDVVVERHEMPRQRLLRRGTRCYANSLQ